MAHRNPDPRNQVSLREVFIAFALIVGSGAVAGVLTWNQPHNITSLAITATIIVALIVWGIIHKLHNGD